MKIIDYVCFLKLSSYIYIQATILTSISLPDSFNLISLNICYGNWWYIYDDLCYQTL